MAKKAGRNDPCPCGSGKKYKQCCLRQNPHTESATSLTVSTKGGVQKPPDSLLEAEDKLAEISNAAVDLIQAGNLDEAERVARDLLARFPDVHDGYDRLGMVYEARGDWTKAIECYQRVIDIVRDHPGHYDSDFESVIQRSIDRLHTLATHRL